MGPFLTRVDVGEKRLTQRQMTLGQEENFRQTTGHVIVRVPPRDLQEQSRVRRPLLSNQPASIDALSSQFTQLMWSVVNS